jgi:hypothetical protein
VTLTLALLLIGGLLGVLGQNPAPPCPLDGSCKLPNCFCSTTTTENISPRWTAPQLVTLTFDDAVNVLNYEYYQTLFARTNPNGAKIGVTYFVTHDYCDYSLVHQLFRNHHEIALHSITHQVNTTYWQTLPELGWKMEVVDQLDLMNKFAKVPKPLMKGFRAPFLQTGGNAMYRVLKDDPSLQWESSMPTIAHRKPGLWPYTNDYSSIQDCQIEPCRNQSFPGFWTYPMIVAMGGNGFSCSMVDTCLPTPVTAQETYDLLKKNFDDHYEFESGNVPGNPGIVNRAPFPIAIHYAWIVDEQRRAGLNMFLDYLHDLPDVYMVTISQAIEYVKNPVLSSAITPTSPSYLAVKNPLPDGCAVKYTCPYTNVPPGGDRYMGSCVPCSPNYPWLGNPLGL